ncbi:DUF805 domain-containing protein [Streptomyces sp. NPDC055607]
MNWYLNGLKKYADFQGRARRQEFWAFTLCNWIITFAVTLVDTAFGTIAISLVYCLAVFLPSLAVAVRRLHDTGRSGWMLLLVLVPIVGAIVFIVFAVTEGDRHPNAHGPNPKLTPAY